MVLSGNKFINFFKIILLYSRVYIPWNFYAMYKNRKKRIPSMSAAQSFYSNNAERIGCVKNYLYDEKSKVVFSKLIHMRQFYDFKDIPPYNYFNQYFPNDIIKFSENEVFIDCGAFNGDIVKQFIKYCPS